MDGRTGALFSNSVIETVFEPGIYKFFPVSYLRSPNSGSTIAGDAVLTRGWTMRNVRAAICWALAQFAGSNAIKPCRSCC